MAEDLPPNNHTYEGLQCWYKKTMKQVGWVLSMPLEVQIDTSGLKPRAADQAQADSLEVRRTEKTAVLKMLKAEILLVWTAMGQKMEFELALFEQSQKSSVVIYERHQDLRIQMNHLKTLLDVLSGIEF